AQTATAFQLSTGAERSRAFKLLADDLAFLERGAEVDELCATALPHDQRPDIFRGYADVLTRAGQLPRASECYEFRWLLAPLSELRPRQIAPEWHGQSLQGKRVLMRLEQGIGDNFQYLRYAKHLQALGAVTLVGRFSDVVDCFDGISDSEVPDGAKVDYYVDTASLPRVFGTTIDQLPDEMPYARATREKVMQWRARLSSPGQLKVGLVGAGNPAHSRDAD